MKELSIEGNAYDGNYKTYTELINRLEDVKNAIKKQNYGIAMDILCKPYPEYQITTSTELKESDGLRIIKAIKYGLDHVFTNNTTVFEVTKEQCLSWLEKQGEHANFRNKIQVGDKVTRNEDGVLVNLSQLKRIAKPAEEYNITGIGSKNAQGKLGEMIKNLKPVNEVLEQKPDWNEKYIADVFEKVGLAKIAREQGNENLSSALQSALIELGKFMPQQKQEWSEEDEYYLNSCITKIEIDIQNWEGHGKTMIDVDKEIISWLKSLKDRVQSQPKQEWSEDDEKMYNVVHNLAWESYKTSRRLDIPTFGIINDWLKSLRPQNTWKPSDEQMEGLECTIKTLKYQLNCGDNRLDSLYNNLKKLRGK